MNSVKEVFEVTSKSFHSLDDYISKLPPSRQARIYNKSQMIIASRIKNNYELLTMALSEDTLYEKNRSYNILKMVEVIVTCMTFYRANKELSRKYYAEKIENYPTHIRWLMMQFYINENIDYVSYFKRSYKIKFKEHAILSIAKTKDDVCDTIENGKASELVKDLIDDTIDFCDVNRHLSRKEYALLAASEDKTKIGLRMSQYDDKIPDYVRYINKNYYVFERIQPIMEISL